MAMNVHPNTARAVSTQTWAMDCDFFDVSIVKYGEGRQTVGTFTREGIGVVLSDLVRQNMVKHENIFIRPEPKLNRALILVDDVEEPDIEELRSRGVEPCLILETSHRNYQAWVDLGREPMPKAERSIVARQIAETVNADKNSADAEHYGRMAGFLNLKPEHLGEGKNGGFPFVMVRYASKLVCSKAGEIREWAARRAQEATRATETQNTVAHKRMNISGLKNDFTRYCQWWADHEPHARRHDGSDDLSARDFSVVSRLIHEGYPPESIIPVLAEASGRKNDPVGYATRTVGRASSHR